MIILLRNWIIFIYTHLFCSEYAFTHVSDEEDANCIYANGALLRRPTAEFPSSNFSFKYDINGKTIHDKFKVPVSNHIELENSELRKVDGALTCCSVLF